MSRPITIQSAYYAGRTACLVLRGAPFRLVLDTALDILKADSLTVLPEHTRAALASGALGKRCPV